MSQKKFKSLKALVQSKNIERECEHKAVAVALNYDSSKVLAPTVAASGERKQAIAIKRIARRYGVRVEKMPKLARALAAVNMEEEIPQELYLEVARLLCDQNK